MLSFRHKKETSKNVADITFKFTHYYIRKLYFYLEVKELLEIYFKCIYEFEFSHQFSYHGRILILKAAIFTKFLFSHHMIALQKL